MKQVILAFLLMTLTALYAEEELPEVDTTTSSETQQDNSLEKDALQDAMPEK